MCMVLSRYDCSLPCNISLSPQDCYRNLTLCFGVPEGSLGPPRAVVHTTSKGAMFPFFFICRGFPQFVDLSVAVVSVTTIWCCEYNGMMLMHTSIEQSEKVSKGNLCPDAQQEYSSTTVACTCMCDVGRDVASVRADNDQSEEASARGVVSLAQHLRPVLYLSGSCMCRFTSAVTPVQSNNDELQEASAWNLGHPGTKYEAAPFPFLFLHMPT